MYMLKHAELKKLFGMFLHCFQKLILCGFMNFVPYFIITLYNRPVTKILTRHSMSDLRTKKEKLRKTLDKA
jgi:hypothetical protein